MEKKEEKKILHLSLLLNDRVMDFLDLEPVLQCLPPGLKPKLQVLETPHIQLFGYLHSKLNLAPSLSMIGMVLAPAAPVDRVLPALDPEGHRCCDMIVHQDVSSTHDQGSTEYVRYCRISRRRLEWARG